MYRYGIKVALRLAGMPIGPSDTAIAGHTIAVGTVLVTNNTREFERVSSLLLEDWIIVRTNRSISSYTCRLRETLIDLLSLLRDNKAH